MATKRPATCMRSISAGVFSSIMGTDLAEVAHAAGISPETLRKIGTGRLPSPGFGTIVRLGEALDVPLQDLAATWRGDDLPLEAAS